MDGKAVALVILSVTVLCLSATVAALAGALLAAKNAYGSPTLNFPLTKPFDRASNWIKVNKKPQPELNSRVARVTFMDMPREIIVKIIGYCPDNLTLQALLKASKITKALWDHREDLRHLCADRIMRNHFDAIIREIPRGSDIERIEITGQNKVELKEANLFFKSWLGLRWDQEERTTPYKDLRRAKYALIHARGVLADCYDVCIRPEVWERMPKYLWWLDDWDVNSPVVVWYRRPDDWESLLDGIDTLWWSSDGPDHGTGPTNNRRLEAYELETFTPGSWNSGSLDEISAEVEEADSSDG